MKKENIGFLKNCMLMLFGLFFALITLEVGLRTYYFITDKQFFGLKPVRTTIKWQEDKQLGKRLIPNQAGWFVPHSQEYFTWIEVNSQGWPDVEHDYQKPEGIYRVIFLGDSFVENTQMPLEKRFFRQIEKAFPETEVIALGLGNSGTAQQLIILQKYGVKYQPDLVVHMFLTANDIKNNSFVLQNDPYLPYFDNNLELIPAKLRSQRPLGQLREDVKKFRTVELLLSIRQKYLTKKKNFASGYPIDYQVYNRQYSKEYQEAWNLTKKLILESKKATEEIGARYMLVVLTNNEQVHQSIWQEALKTYSEMDSKDFDLEKPDRLLKEFCELEKIECYFMLPYFKDYLIQNPEAITHNRFEGHWNELGTNLSAAFLKKILETKIPAH